MILGASVWKKLVIELCRKGVIPLMFQLKMRIELASGELGGESGRMADAATAADNFRRFGGGGLMVRFMMRNNPMVFRHYRTVILGGALR